MQGIEDISSLFVVCVCLGVVCLCVCVCVLECVCLMGNSGSSAKSFERASGALGVWPRSWVIVFDYID